MRIVAFYLPQFHTIPENDTWWGDGFTEWKTVKNGRAYYEEQYQPREPLNGNYYNLLNVETLRWQANLAKEYGVYGFCFYHYWFEGKMLLEKPAEILLNNKNIDVHFSFCWANENWSRSWAGNQKEILMQQTYGGKEDWERHFNYLLPFFLDKRYIKNKNKPMLTIYRPENIPNLKEMCEFFNKKAIQNGFDGISFSYQQVDFYKSSNKDKTLFDFRIEYEPAYYFYDLREKEKSFIKRFFHKLSCKITLLFSSKKKSFLNSKKYHCFDYNDAWKFILSRRIDDKAVPCAFVDWDNTARHGANGTFFKNVSADSFKKYFGQLVKKTKAESSCDLIFVFAWNEWGEGGHLEPDNKNKFGFLEAIRESVGEE